MDFYTEEERNTELDYIICERLEITMDELDALQISNVELYRKEISYEL